MTGPRPALGVATRGRSASEQWIPAFDERRGNLQEDQSPVEQFTGKELDAETSLSYFGARYYMAAMGRWGAVDPLADRYPGWSPYNFVLGKPNTFLDPDGMQVAAVAPDDIYFDVSGSEVDRDAAPGPDRYFIRTESGDYQLRGPLSPEMGPYTFHEDPGEITETALALSDGAPRTTNVLRFIADSRQGSDEDPTARPYDFKRHLGRNELWNAGGGRAEARDYVGNMAWSNFARRRMGWPLLTVRAGAHAQAFLQKLRGFELGFDQPGDQSALIRGYRMGNQQ